MLSLVVAAWISHIGSWMPAFVGIRTKPSTSKASLNALVGDDGTTFVRYDGYDDAEALLGDEKSGEKTARRKKAKLEPLDDTWWEGLIKSYNAEKGFGFIACDELFQKYKADVFLHQRQVRKHLGSRAFGGDQVRFLVGMNEAGKPQAVNVERRVGSHWIDFSKVYVGTVKEYWPDKGFGFIACPETQMVFQSDIFLHKNEVEKNSLVKGNRVTFSVQVNNKNRPQARYVERLTPITSEAEVAPA